MPTGLSQSILQDFRIAAANAALVQLGAGTRLELQASRHTMLHLVLAGTASVGTHAGAPPVVLQAGDTAMLFYGDAHSIGDTGRAVAQAFEIPAASLVDDELPVLIRGEGATRATILSCELQLTYISGSALAIRAGPPLWPMRVHPPADTEGGQALVLDLAQILSSIQGIGSLGFAVVLANLLFVHTVRDQYRALWHDQPMEVRSPAVRRLAAALQAMQSHPDRAWTVAKLAQEVGLSRSSFAASFTATIGTPPLSYLNQVRMARAKQLLSRSTIPVAEVARRSGYPVQSSFARAFAAFFGMTPTQFARTENQGTEKPASL